MKFTWTAITRTKFFSNLTVCIPAHEETASVATTATAATAATTAATTTTATTTAPEQQQLQGDAALMQVVLSRLHSVCQPGNGSSHLLQKKTTVNPFPMH
jgi:hypothetical protein